ncbi:hypothetical protein DY000_02032981 [Brassica cretica]|uniref:Uncharacterized protein n=1 Tax=Brassica cretica TaxID=69181 RepID=A0ABQ7DX36_BRACR|nr:hypothetical protein DY000_02032981 [Brassica cretica]
MFCGMGLVSHFEDRSPRGPDLEDEPTAGKRSPRSSELVESASFVGELVIVRSRRKTRSQISSETLQPL